MVSVSKKIKNRKGGTPLNVINLKRASDTRALKLKKAGELY
nr:MAG TPA: hypothetical protein [Caudoviricetes sp.]DAQ59161.1 MAG TPA: hypothetical protein [Caudoviricetes sp.]